MTLQLSLRNKLSQTVFICIQKEDKEKEFQISYLNHFVFRSKRMSLEVILKLRKDFSKRCQLLNKLLKMMTYYSLVTRKERVMKNPWKRKTLNSSPLREEVRKDSNHLHSHHTRSLKCQLQDLVLFCKRNLRRFLPAWQVKDALKMLNWTVMNIWVREI